MVRCRKSCRHLTLLGKFYHIPLYFATAKTAPQPPAAGALNVFPLCLSNNVPTYGLISLRFCHSFTCGCIGDPRAHRRGSNTARSASDPACSQHPLCGPGKPDRLPLRGHQGGQCYRAGRDGGTFDEFRIHKRSLFSHPARKEVKCSSAMAAIRSAVSAKWSPPAVWGVSTARSRAQSG